VTAEVPVLKAPAEPVPPVVDSAAALIACAESIRNGSGPIAVDAERAGGYRYSQRAYLLQFNRRGSGIWLVDPVAIDDFGVLAEALAADTWVLHAASQDLPGMADLGLHPPDLFDTELAGRLLNVPRVGLSAMTEQFLGVSLAKSHSAADWSKRPLPDTWLTYAALDVELLLDLADLLQAELAAANRTEWAREEFAALREAPAPQPQPDRWRRTKGLKATTPRSLAVARELWTARDELAAQLDRTPSKVLSDAAIAGAAAKPPQNLDEVKALPGLERERPDRQRRWLAAVGRALQLPEDQLPPRRAPSTAPPDPRSWDRIDPELAAGYQRVKLALTALADELEVPRENLVPPKVVKESVWALFQPTNGSGLRPLPDVAQVTSALHDAGARPWQIGLTAEVIALALQPDGPSEHTDITRE
jgi:ribonuclease D